MHLVLRPLESTARAGAGGGAPAPAQATAPQRHAPGVPSVVGGAIVKVRFYKGGAQFGAAGQGDTLREPTMLGWMVQW